jgi:serine phosphatase RsbU (regulator of sigma subunit)
MGQVRNALRAYALKGAAPAAVMDDLHALVDAARGEITFATVIYVVLDLTTGAGEVATAGHLPPLLVGEKARYLDTPRCPPLGFSGAGACRSERFVLGAGETLWLFTDGLVESRRRPIDTGLAALADAAERATGSLEAIAEHLLVSLPSTRDDDIALLGLRRLG